MRIPAIFTNITKPFSMQKHACLFTIFFLLSCFGAFAQSNTAIKGFVYEKGNGEPMPSTLVVLKGTKIGVQTDVNGYFSMQVPPGPYTIYTVLLGYDTAYASGKVDAGQVVSQKIFISPRTIDTHRKNILEKTDSKTIVGLMKFAFENNLLG